MAGRLRFDPFFGGDPAAMPPAGLLWSNAIAAGVSVRNYGLWASAGANGRSRVQDPALEPYTELGYPAFDLSVPDGRRVDVFLEDFSRISRLASKRAICRA
jgi:hypothetical protein